MTDQSSNSTIQSPPREEDYEIYDIMAKLLSVPKKKILESIELFSNIDPNLEKCFSRLYEVKSKNYETVLMILNHYLFRPKEYSSNFLKKPIYEDIDELHSIRKMPKNLQFTLLDRSVTRFLEALNITSRILDELIENNHLEIEKSYKELEENQNKFLDMTMHLLSIDNSMDEVKEKIEKLMK